MKRGQAEQVIDDIRVAMSRVERSALEIHAEIEGILVRAGLPPLQRCQGDAHQNPYIESLAHAARLGEPNCTMCAPRCGFVGERAKVR